MRVSVVRDSRDFEELRPAWNELLECSNEASPFLSWEWQEAWWRTYGRRRELSIFVAKVGPDIVGLLPAYGEAASSWASLSGRRLRLVGTGGDTSPDYLGMLVHPEFEDAASTALLEVALDVGRVDAVSFSDVSRGSRLEGAFSEVARRRGLRPLISPPTRITVLPLPTTWDGLLKQMERHWRQEVRRRRRRLAEKGARCVVWQDAQTLQDGFDRLAALHRLRWSRRGERRAFSSPEYLAFHRMVMDRFLARGWLRLFGLELGEETIAMRYCFRFRDDVFAFQSGFDPAYARYSPGVVLMSYVIEHSIQEGARVVDMLKGKYPHKEAWSHEYRETTRLRVYRRTPAGLSLWLREVRAPAAARFLRNFFGPRESRR